MLVSCSEEEGGRVRVGKVQVLFRISVIVSINSQKYPFMQDMKVARSIHTVVETLGRAFHGVVMLMKRTTALEESLELWRTKV